MRAISHFTASGVASIGAYAAFGPAPAAGLFLAGSLIDVDHIPLYRNVGLPMKPKDLFLSLFRNEGQIERAYSVRRGVPMHWYFPALHSIELFLAMLAAGLLIPSGLLTGAAVGMGVHLLMDGWSYPCGAPFFSMIWRSRHRDEVLRAWGEHRVKVRL